MSDRDTRYVLGVGCTGRATMAAVLAAIDACLAEAGLTHADLVGLGTTHRRSRHLGLRGAAMALGVPLRVFSDAELATQAKNLATPSDRVAALTGLPGVAEAAALMAGPLLVPRRTFQGVTCALAQTGPGFTLEGFGAPA